MPLEFIPYGESWLASLVPMWREAFEHGNGIKDTNPIERQRAYFLSEVLPAYEVTLAVDHDLMVGFMASSLESVSQLHVRVGHHRAGIGTALIERAKQRSSGSLWLYTFTRNVNACRFYEKQGFIPVDYGFEPTWQADDVKYRWVRASGFRAATPSESRGASFKRVV